MIRVPFSTPDIDGGLSEGKGVLTLDGDTLTIEVDVAFMGLFKRDSRRVRFDITDLDQVRHRRSPLGDRVTFRTDPMDLVGRVPGAAQGELVLKTKKKHRRDVEALLERLELWIVE
ncbi:MAG TPA: hypothetical protein EYQ24_00460 [Bacteroidetes bacterium]|nr:hypothetical protein [Bacteroidota bacterium]HIL58281.1 hypothetical protein [Rhodothermales bacterium]